MKVILVLFVIAISSCQVNKTPITVNTFESGIIEDTILWQAKADPDTWVPIELEKLVNNTEKYTKEGKFYKAKGDVYAFDRKVLYVGLIGSGDIRGPNVLLEGDPGEVSASIAKKYPINFIMRSGAFFAHLGEHIKLLVVPHPYIKNTSIVIGAYYGQ